MLDGVVLLDVGVSGLPRICPAEVDVEDISEVMLNTVVDGTKVVSKTDVASLAIMEGQ